MASEKRRNKESRKAKKKKQKKLTEALPDSVKEVTHTENKEEGNGDSKEIDEASANYKTGQEEKKENVETAEERKKDVKDSFTANNGGEGDDSDDDELMAAAAAWARQQVEGEDVSSRHDSLTLSPHDSKLFSLHMTQLPFDANELDIRKLFAENGCMITSIRLVYDKDERGRKTLFRGVAFVDLMDASSYAKALELNRRSMRGRKINIRPTRSKQELADIVSRTKELVQSKIQKQQAGQMDDNQNSKLVAERKRQKNQQKKMKKKANKAKHKTPKENKDEASQKKTDSDRKLTKKERNRKAAIILSMRRKRGK